MYYMIFTYVSFLCVLISCVAYPSTNVNNERRPHQEHDHSLTRPDRRTLAENYLEKYGYLEQNRRVNRQEKQDAIKSFQHYNGLRETGKLNRRTIHKMTEPRCGIPDDVHPEIQRRKKRQAYRVAIWKKKVVTWKPLYYSRKLPITAQWKTLKQALKAWSQVIPRYFRFTTGTPDISIVFASGEHGDGYYNSFDGKGMTLAHAFQPGDRPISGDAHFDDDEDWTLGERSSYSRPNLLMAATHEFGHALGLGHSYDPNSLMSPYFVSSKRNLTNTDIRLAQRIYGKKERRILRPFYNDVLYKPPNEILGQHWDPSTSTTTTVVPEVPKSALKTLLNCRGIDAMFVDSAGYINIISNNTLFQVDGRSKSRTPVTLRSVYPAAPLPVSAAAYIKGRLYLFKESHVWRYTKYSLDAGFPKRIETHDKGEQPTAALVTRGRGGRRIFLFGKYKFWEWNTWTDDVMGGKQHTTSQFWKGVPESPDAAVIWSDLHIYFVKDDLYYKLSQRSRRISRGYPRRLPMPWIRDIC